MPVRATLNNLRTNGGATRLLLAFWFSMVGLLGIWPALTNGQPFFFADSTAYVRGADLAMSKLFGSRFATSWAKDQRREIAMEASGTRSELAAPGQKPAQRTLLAGRSIIYGALLYLGALTGGMWFPIIVQSLVMVYLVSLFILRVLGLDFGYFLISCGVLFLASPLPFYVSNLMPDVFAGLLILGFAMLATGWDRLSNRDRAITTAVLLFAVLSHRSHGILLIGLTALTATYLGLTDLSHWRRIRGLVSITAICALMALLWEFAFSVGVSRAVGTPLVQPPFVTARLTSLLDKPAISQACASNAFAVCKFRDRLPVDSDSFLWSEDQHTAVFSVADAQTKRVLGEEQLRFALAVIPPNLGRVVSGVLHESLRQLTFFGLDEYYYSAEGLAFFESRLPNQDFRRMSSSSAAGSRIYVMFGRTVLYVSAVLSAALIVGLASGALRARSEKRSEQESVWRAATYILLAGIVLNAIICGGLTSVNNRYQARVVWLVQLSAITGICVMRPFLRVASLFKPKSEERIAVSQG